MRMRAKPQSARRTSLMPPKKTSPSAPEAAAILAAAQSLAITAVTTAQIEGRKVIASAAADALVVVQTATTKALSDFPRLQDDIREIRKAQADYASDNRADVQALTAEVRAGFVRTNGSVIKAQTSLTDHERADEKLQADLVVRLTALEKLHTGFKKVVWITFAAAIAALFTVVSDVAIKHWWPTPSAPTVVSQSR